MDPLFSPMTVHFLFDSINSILNIKDSAKLRVVDQWTSGGSWYVDRIVMGDLSNKIRPNFLTFGLHVTAKCNFTNQNSVSEGWTRVNLKRVKHVDHAWLELTDIYGFFIQNLFRMKGKGLKERILANRQLNALSMMKKAAKESS